MRVNVYHEEMADEVEFVEKKIPETGRTYYGLRMFMKSIPELHHTDKDDDRSAITFWWETESGLLRHMETVRLAAMEKYGTQNEQKLTRR